MKRLRQVLFAGLVVPPSLFCGNALGAVDDELDATLNFAYATILGTGAYKVGERSVYVLSFPFSMTLREPGEAQWGVKLELPFTVGVHDFELRDVVEDHSLERLETLGFTPGLEVSIPLDEHWTIKPYGQIGYTVDLQEDHDAYVYIGGVKSLSVYPLERVTLSLGAAVTVAGQSEVSGSNSSGFGVASLGLDVRRALGVELYGHQLEGSLYVIANKYFDQLEFLDVGDEEFSIDKTMEIGITLGTERPVKFMGVNWQRVGVGFVYGDEIEAISFNLGFPF